MPDVRVNKDIVGFNGAEIVIRLGHDELVGGRIDLSKAMQDAAKEIATAYIEENMSAVMGKMDPTAVANLAIAESAQLIRKQFIDPKKEDKDESK